MASVTMILGVILLVTGSLVVNEANEGLKRSLVHSSEGETRVHISMQKDHTYDVKIEIEATKFEEGIPTFTNTSAIAVFFLMDILPMRDSFMMITMMKKILGL